MLGVVDHAAVYVSFVYLEQVEIYARYVICMCLIVQVKQ